jgi:hypothetical protein
MTKDEAKLLLSVCRPCGADDSQPIMKEARECIGCDEDLAGSIAEARNVDAALSEKMCRIQVPCSLMAEIMAGARLTASRPQSWTGRYGRWLAAAAAVAISSPLFWPQSPEAVPQSLATVTEFREEIAKAFSEMKASPVGYIASYLTQSTPDAERFFKASSASVTDLPQEGIIACRVIVWRGHRVALCCLSKQGQKAHLFVVPESSIQESDFGEVGQIGYAHGLPIKVWREGQTVRALVGDDAKTELPKFDDLLQS